MTRRVQDVSRHCGDAVNLWLPAVLFTELHELRAWRRGAATTPRGQIDGRCRIPQGLSKFIALPYSRGANRPPLTFQNARTSRAV